MTVGREALGKGSFKDVLISGGISKSPNKHHRFASGPYNNNKRTQNSKLGLTWRSLHTTMEGTSFNDPRGQYFPDKLAMSAGLVKLLLSAMMIGLGVLSLILDAALSNLGGGLWAGIVVGVSGFLGVCAARRPHIWVYVLGFMTLGGVSMAASGILVVVSATAWAKDNQETTAVFIHEDSAQPVESLGEVLLRRPSVLVSGALAVLGVIDCLVSLACIVISVRETCALYIPRHHQHVGFVEGHNRKERLYRWLGQQKHIFPQRPSQPLANQFVQLSSSESYSSGLSPPKTVSTDPGNSSSNNSSNLSHNKLVAAELRLHTSSNKEPTPLKHRSRSPKKIPSSKIIMSPNPNYYSDHSFVGSSHSLLQVSPVTTSPSANTPHFYRKPPRFIAPPPPFILPPPHRRYRPRSRPAHPSYPVVHRNHPERGLSNRQFIPHHHHHHHSRHQIPNHTSHPSLFYPHLVTPMMPYYPYQQNINELPKEKRKPKKERHQKSPKKKEKREKKPRRKRPELTDEQIERTYTGLDRHIAEGFINSSMEPGISINKVCSSSFEQDSF